MVKEDSMKKLILLAIGVVLVLMASISFGAPWIESDPYLLTDVQPTIFEVIMGTNTAVDSLPVSGTFGTGVKLRYDLLNATGIVAGKIRACVPSNVVLGERSCSDYVPFSFAIPSPAPHVPNNLKWTVK
jgi:hypothetical protein